MTLIVQDLIFKIIRLLALHTNTPKSGAPISLIDRLPYPGKVFAPTAFYSCIRRSDAYPCGISCSRGLVGTWPRELAPAKS